MCLTATAIKQQTKQQDINAALRTIIDIKATFHVFQGHYTCLFFLSTRVQGRGVTEASGSSDCWRATGGRGGGGCDRGKAVVT